LKGLSKKYERFDKVGGQIVMISADSVEELKEYKSRKGYPFTMLSDSERTVIKEYDLYNPAEREGIAVPAAFVIDRSGVVKFSRLEKTWFRVRPNMLLRKLQEINME
jgi:peroxiredoxin Q/BCP